MIHLGIYVCDSVIFPFYHKLYTIDLLIYKNKGAIVSRKRYNGDKFLIWLWNRRLYGEKEEIPA